ncbi:PHB depolymerase family esterase [Sphingomonas sp. LaA6.9]|uniref:extracellular catalytic domain type 1 short-chain-length polyhydroxyalkanoate depolymerase n=1 Tax=Sphingomonas sp. LaA6.9 TaxID=2919914 RepID=UPI001F4FFB0F|nr:PHB depolymerase family esterase [Sphingomonas sp. LaA6.9]MCJ8157790.1 PHB depolymerase family esterase [Sphingomonas sp. LaA6.9]
MTMTLHPAMAEALRLTRAGNLAEATALIQSTLAGGAQADPSPPTAASCDIIDLKPCRVMVSSPERAVPREVRVLHSTVPPGAAGTFNEQNYSGAAGSLAYRLYIPHGATAGMPLVVMLHGCTQSPEDFARGTDMNRLADEFGFLVAYPSQTRGRNAQKCWNWFKPGDQRRDRGEPALIAGITRQVIADQRADAARVYVAGLSAGGAAAAIMGAAYPDLYAAIGIHSGLACGAARDLPSALAAMRSGGSAGSTTNGSRFVPVITFHGDRDTTVHQINSRQIIAAAYAAAGGFLQTRTETGRSAGGRGYTCDKSVDDKGQVLIEQWTIHGAGHAWSGGNNLGSYTDPTGPDASREMLRFFLDHRSMSNTHSGSTR